MINTNERDISRRIQDIEKRNARVESEKAWEVSTTRKFVIALLTYGATAIFFALTDSAKPLFNALVATIGFVLSTLTIPFFKNLWIRSLYLRKEKSARQIKK